MSAIPAAQRRQVERRDGGCVVCGASPYDVHHRQRRREGGHDIANLVALCRLHHDQAHAHPRHARAWGLIVPTWADYATQPVWLAQRGAWAVLTAAGEYELVA